MQIRTLSWSNLIAFISKIVSKFHQPPLLLAQKHKSKTSRLARGIMRHFQWSFSDSIFQYDIGSDDSVIMPFIFKNYFVAVAVQ